MDKQNITTKTDPPDKNMETTKTITENCTEFAVPPSPIIIDVIDDDKSTVSDTKGSSDFR